MYFPLIKNKLSSWLAGAITFSSVILPQTFCFNQIAQAQVGASPLVIQVEAQRGKAQGIITVKNPTNKPSRVRIYAEAFTYDREQGFQTLAESEQDLSDYLRFSPREMTIPAQSERRVRLLATLPPSLPDGEYRSVVFAENLTETIDAQKNEVAVITRVGVTVYVGKGDLNPNLTVENAFYDRQNGKIKLLVNNSGGSSVLPKLVWKLTQNDQIVVEGENPQVTIIAGGDRFLQLSPIVQDEEGAAKPIPLQPGNYQLSGDMIWEIDNNDPNVVPFEIELSIPN